ncbi:ABC transporter G family member 2 [Rhynchospora pubera]|uniref:ABC transporter G family member 2 n=1 Tax=Rhynchospora pubera TaxID=906938 RepID=A0AAV8FGP9_9POAL|nr:ABC transporter G family member 2 [Rhynchospora pubera]
MASQSTATESTLGASPWRPLWPADNTRNDAGTEPINQSNISLASLFDLSSRRTTAIPKGALQNDSSTISVTWQDLWVSAVDNKRKRKSIICGLNGFAQPGRVLAIMGPSGCGKSTLLDALAGRLASNVKQTGKILINVLEQKLAFGTSAYVTQDDVLITTLTVKEAVCYSAQLQLPDTMSWSEKKERALDTIREMGLEGVMDTRIGGWSSKGISGGQKRRVSICTEILTRPKLLFLDEPTSGLDSAAAYHVMSRIISLAKREGMTVVGAIHQPSSEVFHLFHGLCLLAYGKTVFFGQPNEAILFFASNGFVCPHMSNPSDYFLRIINKDFDKDEGEQHQQHKYDIEAQPTTNTTQAIEILMTSFELSGYSIRVSENIEKLRFMGGVSVKKFDQPSFLNQCSVLTKRSFVNMSRDLGYYWLRFAIYIAVGITLGTIFHKFDHSYESIQGRINLLVYVASFLTFMSIGGFPSFIEDIKIFARERLNGHYGVMAFIIANTLSALPFLLLIASVPGAVAYFLAGLRAELDHFAYFVLDLFTSLALVESLMMIVASIVPDFLMGIITGAGIQGVMMLTSGFFQLSNLLPNIILKYPIHYISFDKYSTEGFFKNEFLGDIFQSSATPGAPTISGDQFLKDEFHLNLVYSKWIDLAVLFGMFVLYRMLFLLIVKVKDMAKPMITQGFCMKEAV